MTNAKVRRLALSGMLSALVLLFTYLVKLPVPATGGYIHLGDGVIFLAAWLLGPSAALIAGVGSALADVLGGYFIYALPTFVIKAAMGALAGHLLRRGKPLRNALVFALAEGVMIAGYFLLEWALYGGAAALAAAGGNLLQGLSGIALGLLLTRFARHMQI
ncbi:MAG: ECF transporter S component [Oscillospiraceae bacterium]|jgi:uncharacterized membrane protein|nr:ECF transporter S component [Oscillospiraceae bacterium]